MNLQVLVSTMRQENHELLNEMNIQSDAIIINQGDYNLIEEFTHREKNIKFISLDERGIGLSRNTALMRASADICLFADDDVVYEDGYEELVIDAFKNTPDADVIVFNVPSTNKERPSPEIKKLQRVFVFNCLRYGTFCVAIKTESIRKKNIYFSLLFGGGAKYGSGEDSLFLITCLKAGLRMYANPSIIGNVTHNDSTWFKGYNEKYFKDKGALFACLSRRWGRLLCLQLLIRHPEIWKGKFKLRAVYRMMKDGMKMQH